jgi:DnaK suppressor protein
VAKTTAKKPSKGKQARTAVASKVKNAPPAKKPAPKAVKLVKKAVVMASAKSAKKPAASPTSKSASAKSATSKSAAKPVKAARAAEAPAKAATPVARITPRDESRRSNGTPPAPSVPEAVPTDGKPRKNQAGLTSRELEHFRDLLLAKRRELIGDMSAMEREALRSTGSSNLSNLPIHMADMGTDNYEQEFTLGLVQKDRDLLREINQALAKIQNGTYGICEGTGKPINKERLEYQPWARYSIEYARILERRGGGRP